MAITFAKKAASAAKADDNKSPSEDTPAENKTTSKSTSGNAGSTGGSIAGWMKKGKDAKQAVATEDAKSEQAKAEAGKLFRFFMKVDQDRTLTFLDGELDEDGMLDIPMYYEHMVKANGNWNNFVCVGEQEPCPICEKGDSKSALVGVLTVIDHTPYKIQSGQNAGKTIQNTRKLYVCKRHTIKQLSKIAAKRGGLTGCTFEVSRTGDKEPNVGNQFDFIEKHEKLSDIAAKYDLKLEEVQPGDYATEISYLSADELLELGVGKSTSGIGSEKGVSSKALKDEL